MNPPSLCIVSHNAYGAISGSGSGHIGGVEWQTTLTAKWFAHRGYRVTLLTWNEGAAAGETFDGVRVIKICRQKAGLKGLRFFHPKWTGLIRAMRAANADLYYHNTAECVTGQVALWCRRNGKKFVFSSANDTDCSLHLPELRFPWERWLYRYGLRNADRLIVQTQTQRKMLRDGFGLESVVIPMPSAGAAPNAAVSRSAEIPRRALWVARVTRQKRPDRLLDLAKVCPDVTFDFVGPFSGANGIQDDYASAVKERAGGMANVVVHGPVPRDRLAEFYRGSSCFCSTSDYEGFPNTFLEAWSCGLPIVSTFDPDGVIVKHNLGIVARDIPEMRSALYSLLGSPERFQECSRNARRYFVENHQAEAVLPRFETLFLETLQDKKNKKRN